jgi:hypothetical protein
MLETCSNLSSEIQDLRTTCGCSTMGHNHTSLFLCERCSERIFCKPPDWLWFTIKWPPPSPDSTTTGNSLCGSIKGGWLRVTTPPTKSFAELWRHSFSPLLHKCSDACHRVHGGTSAFVSSIKEHKRIFWTCNQEVPRLLKLIMIAQCLMYSDFSPTLYVHPVNRIDEPSMQSRKFE